MTKKTVLLVDFDARSQRVLEVSLKKAGFDVHCESTADGALTFVKENIPDVVVSETELLGGTNGFELCRRLRDDPKTSKTAVAFLAIDASPEAKIRAISAGADEFWSKPLFVKEIIQRLNGLLERRSHEALSHGERPANFTGSLDVMGLADLFQVIEIGKKTCTLRVRTNPRRSGQFATSDHETATIYFRDGQLIDANAAHRLGEAAVYRVFLWEDGDFEMEFVPSERDATITRPTQVVLLEGMRRLDEWTSLARQLPPLGQVLEVNFKAAAMQGEAVPEEVEALLHLFDGRRAIIEVVDESALDDLVALSIVARLLAEGVLIDKARRVSMPAPPPLSLDAWLSAPPRAASIVPPAGSTGDLQLVGEPGLPSALSGAMIPSAESVSQLLSAAALGVTEIARHAPHETALPEPLPEESPILLRRSIPPVLTRVSIPAQPRAVDTKVEMQENLQLAADAYPHAASIPSDETAQTVHAEARFAPADEEPEAAASPRTSLAPRARRTARSQAYRSLRRPSVVPSMPPPSVASSPIQEVDDTTEKKFQTGPTPSKPTQPEVHSPHDIRDAATVVALPGATRPAATPPSDVQPRSTQDVNAVPPRMPLNPAIDARVPDARTHNAPAAEASITVTTARRPSDAEDLDQDFARMRTSQAGYITEEYSDARGTNTMRIAISVVAVALLVFLATVFLYPKDKGNDGPAEIARPKSTAEFPTPPPSSDQPVPSPVGSPVPAPEAAVPPPAPSEIPVGQAQAQPAGTATTTQQHAAVAVPQNMESQAARAQAVAPAAMPSRSNAQDLEAAMALLKKENYAAAKKAFSAILTAAPDDPRARAGLAHALYGLGNDALAEKEATLALQRDPNVARAYLVRGFVFTGQGKEREAAAAYRRYLELEPEGQQAAEIRRFLGSQR